MRGCVRVCVKWHWRANVFMCRATTCVCTLTGAVDWICNLKCAYCKRLTEQLPMTNLAYRIDARWNRWFLLHYFAVNPADSTWKIVMQMQPRAIGPIDGTHTHTNFHLIFYLDQCSRQLHLLTSLVSRSTFIDDDFSITKNNLGPKIACIRRSNWTERTKENK